MQSEEWEEDFETKRKVPQSKHTGLFTHKRGVIDRCIVHYYIKASIPPFGGGGAKVALFENR
jgi:hypothetical protein